MRPDSGFLREGDIVAVFENGQRMATGAIMSLLGGAAVVADASGKLLWAELGKLVLLARQKPCDFNL